MLVGFTLAAILLTQAEASATGDQETTASAPADTVEPPSAPSYGDRQDIEDLSMADMLDVVISTATKVATPIEKTPAISRVITRRELDRMGVRMLSEVLEYVPGFYEVPSQLDRNFAVRGISGFSAQPFVVLIDGLPMQDFLFSSSSPDLFDLAFVDRIEIVRGPASSLYGGGAMVAVINLISRAAPSSSTTLEAVGSTHKGYRGELRYDSVENDKRFTTTFTAFGSNGAGFDIGAANDALIARAGQNVSDGIQNGENLTLPRGGYVAPAAYAPSFTAFMKYEDGRDFVLRAQLVHVDRVLPRTFRQGIIDVHDEVQEPHYARDRLAIDAMKTWGSRANRGELRLRPSVIAFRHDFASQTMSQDFFAAAGTQNEAVAYGWSGIDLRAGTIVEYALDFPDLGILHDMALLVGGQLEYDVAAGYSQRQCFVDTAGTQPPSLYASKSKTDLYCANQSFIDESTTVDSFGNTNHIKGAANGNADEIRTGGYAQLTGTLPLDIAFVAGTRVDYNAAYGSQLSPRFGLAMPLPAGLYVKTQVARAFVYPGVVARTGAVDSTYLGNFAILPQSVWSGEALVGWRTSMFRAELNGFVNAVNNFATYDQDRAARTGRYFFDNRGKLQTAGVEGMALATYGRVSFELNGAVTHALSASDSQLAPGGKLNGPSPFPTLLGAALLDIQVLDWLSANIRGRYAKAVTGSLNPALAFNGVVGADGGVYSSRSASSYATDSFFLDATVSAELIGHLRLLLRGTNILNAKVFRAGTQPLPELLPGRIVDLAVQYRF